MKNIFSIIVFLFATPIFAAQDWEKSHTDVPYIAIVNEYDVVINNDYSYEETYHVRVKIQHESAKQLQDWPIYYNSQREEILDVNAFTETLDGKKEQATEVSDETVVDEAPLYNNLKVKTIRLPKVEVGSILDVSVKSRVKRNGLLEGFWHSIAFPSIPTQLARYSYDFPTSLPIKYQAHQSALAPKVQEQDGRTKWTFVVNNTDYLNENTLMPPLDQLTGIVSISSLTDWAQVAMWYREISKSKAIDDSGITVDTLQLVKDKLTQKDKAKVIFEFIQDNFRFVPINLSDHNIIPHETIDVYKNKYGDNHDLTLLAHQMLAIAGIDSSLCLFSGEFNAASENYLPNLSIFDHVILEVSLDGSKYFIDPVASGFDIGQLPSSYDNATILVIGGGTWRFDHLPIANEDINTILSSSDIYLEERGSAVFELLVHLPLTASVEFKQNWADTPKEQREKFFDRLQSNFTISGEIIERNIIGVEDRYGLVTFKFKYKAPNAYPLVNDMILLKEPMQDILGELEVSEKRYSALFIPTNTVTVTNNTYHIPEALKIDFIPESFTLKSDAVDVSTKYTKTNNVIKVETIVRQKRMQLPPERFKDLLTFRDNVNKAQDKYIILRKKSTVAPQAKEWIKNQ